MRVCVCVCVCFRHLQLLSPIKGPPLYSGAPSGSKHSGPPSRARSGGFDGRRQNPLFGVANTGSFGNDGTFPAQVSPRTMSSPARRRVTTDGVTPIAGPLWEPDMAAVGSPTGNANLTNAAIPESGGESGLTSPVSRGAVGCGVGGGQESVSASHTPHRLPLFRTPLRRGESEPGDGPIMGGTLHGHSGTAVTAYTPLNAHVKGHVLDLYYQHAHSRRCSKDLCCGYNGAAD